MCDYKLRHDDIYNLFILDHKGTILIQMKRPWKKNANLLTKYSLGVLLIQAAVWNEKWDFPRKGFLDPPAPFKIRQNYFIASPPSKSDKTISQQAHMLSSMHASYIIAHALYSCARKPVESESM